MVSILFGKGANLLARIALGLLLPILGGSLGGIYLDRRFDTHPWLTLLGTISGIFLGFAGLYGTLRSEE
ncbi:TPA: AtpZ/AtpI family protein [Candidatus Poribacteria bacterium]|nr:AtpZ/AtpI family protein [Candidatus Poribacteria bacterium]